MSKTVLITGASRGLGKALAQEFAGQGNRMILSSHNDYPYYPFAFEGEIVTGDIRIELALKRMELAIAKHGLDVLIHCAGIYKLKPFAGQPEYDFKKMIDVNLLAPIRITHALWPTFERQCSGLIVFINSLAGKQGADGETAYSASKHGLAGFARSLQFDAARIGVRVLSVFLGAMKTDMTRHRPDWDKLIDPQEAARAIVGLCEEYSTLGIREVEIGRIVN